MKKLLAVALLSAAVSAPAFAGDTGGYLTADLGSSSLTNAEPFLNPGVVTLGGGYRFSPNLAADLGLTIFGDSTVTIIGITSVTMKLTSFHPAVVGIIPVNDQLSFFGKLGLAINSEKFTSTAGTSTSYSKTSAYYALGGQYNFNNQFGARIQYENFGKFDDFPVAISATAISVGMVFNLQ